MRRRRCEATEQLSGRHRSLHFRSARHERRQHAALRRLLDRAARRRIDRSASCCCRRCRATPAFVREFEPRACPFVDLPRAHGRRASRRGCWRSSRPSYLEPGETESVRIRLAEARANGIIRLPIKAKRLLAARSRRRSSHNGDPLRAVGSPGVASAGWTSCSTSIGRRCSSRRIPGLVFSEVPLLRTARRRGVRSMAIDPSWDNFTNKLIPVRQVDRLVVWNDIMKAQAMELHGYRADAIRVAGAPQLDPHFRASGTPREEFFRRIGADPSRKLIALTTTPRSLYSHHDHVLRVMVRRCDGGALAGAQVLVRLHPRDEMVRVRGVREHAARHYREAVPDDGARRRRPGDRHDAGESAAPRRHAAPQRRRRATSPRRSPSRRHLRHAGRQHRFDGETPSTSRGRRGAITRSRIT